jgi:pteridine reductase
MELTDRVALITGAGRRVGRAIALRLARAGAAVAVHFGTSEDAANDTADECRAMGARAETFQADLARPEEAQGLIRAVLARFQRLDALINNASIFERMRIDDFSVEEWERTLRINLTAPMVLVHAARSALREARGRVLNICDVATQRPWPDHLAYIVSKGALDTLTRVLARALAPDVNVVGVAPGAVVWPEHYDQATRDRLTARIPLQRVGSAEDIAAAVHYLLQEGDYVTGTILPVDGGRHVC